MTTVKAFWKSKTFWASALTALIGGYKIIAPQYGWDARWVEGAVFVLGGLGLWGLRTADTTIGTSDQPAPNPDPAPNVVPGPADPAPKE